MKAQLVTAAFMAIGLHAPEHPASARSVFDRWENGCIDLIDELVVHVPYAEALVEAARKLKGDVPGVPAYEIAEPFGQWYASAILKSSGPGEAPSVNTCRAVLRTMVLRMYECDVGDEMDEALQLVRVEGDVDTCSDCGAQVPSIIGCPDGAEVCPACFDGH